MSWFKVDDRFPRHGKVKALRKLGARVRADALALWTLAGCECCAALAEGGVIEGHISHEDVEAMMHPTKPADARAAAEALVSVGLWHSVEGGFCFHDWSEYQPTAASVKNERDRWKESKRKSRGRPANVPPGHPVDSTACPETPVPVPVPSSFGGLPDAPPEPTGTGPGETVRRLVVAGFVERKTAAPPACKRIGLEPWNALGRWCRETATLEASPLVDPDTVARDLVSGFFADERARAKGYPVAFLAANPSEFRKPAAVVPDPIDLADHAAKRRAEAAERNAKIYGGAQ